MYLPETRRAYQVELTRAERMRYQVHRRVKAPWRRGVKRARGWLARVVAWWRRLARRVWRRLMRLLSIPPRLRSGAGRRGPGVLLRRFFSVRKPMR